MSIEMNNQSINSSTKNGINAPSARVPKSGDTPTQVTSSSPDSVQLSPEALAMAELAQAISDSSDVNIDKVATIKTAVNNGTYNIDIEKLADNIINQDHNFDSPKT